MPLVKGGWEYKVHILKNKLTHRALLVKSTDSAAMSPDDYLSIKRSLERDYPESEGYSIYVSKYTRGDL